MTSRVLPQEEWHQVAHLDIGRFLPYATPAHTEIVVVEREGVIVGCWAVLRITHVEGLWIDPAYRGRVSVARRLFHATMAVARRWTDHWVMTGAQTPEIADLLRRYGATEIPMQTFVMPIGGH
mgnify:CR=1 FL=1